LVKVFQALASGSSILKKAGSSSPRLDAELILGFVLNWDRIKIMTEGESELSGAEYESFLRYIEDRAKGMPIAYITGHKEFMGLDFYIEPGVLIPRADTEVIAETVIRECKSIDGQVSIADVGCGSGAIGISIAHYVKYAFVTMMDISDSAVEISNKNADLNHVKERVKIIKGNLMEPVAKEEFDFVVSNPPYIRTDVIQSLQRDVRDFEPHIALDGGRDGLKYYRQITMSASNCIKAGGMLVYEIGFDQGKAVADIMLRAGFSNINVLKDLAGMDRCIIGKKIC
jgi:release factor glutamine methyltransferase